MLFYNRLRDNTLRFGNEIVANGTTSLWGLWIASAIVAIPIVILCYWSGYGIQEYTQFIAGSITWRGASKTQDYCLLFSLIIGFPSILLAFFYHANLVMRKIGPSAVARFHTLIVIACLPAVIWVGQLVLTRDTSFYLLVFSAVLILLVVIFSGIATHRVPQNDSTAFFEFVSAGAFAVVLGALSGLALPLICNRIFLRITPESYLKGMNFTIIAMVVFSSFSILLFSSVWRRSAKNSGPLGAKFGRMLVFLQGLTPFFFLILVPAPWLTLGHRHSNTLLKSGAWIAVSLLIAIAYADLFRRWRARPERH